MRLRPHAMFVMFALCASAGLMACSATKTEKSAPTSISDRGVQEHGKVWPRSIDSAYMGT